MTGGRGTGAGSDRRNADAARAIKQFLRSASSTTATIAVHVIGPIRNAAAISRAVSFSVTGFTVVIENGTARHTLRHHGNDAIEAKRGQVGVTEEDLARISQLLCEFDTVEPADPTKQGAAQVRLLKRIGMLDYEVFAEVRRSAKQVAFKTMIKRRARAATSS
jgi:ribosomal protein L35